MKFHVYCEGKLRFDRRISFNHRRRMAKALLEGGEFHHLRKAAKDLGYWVLTYQGIVYIVMGGIEVKGPSISFSEL